MSRTRPRPATSPRYGGYFTPGSRRGTATRARLAHTQPLFLTIGATLMDMQESSESPQESAESPQESAESPQESAGGTQESGEGKDESIVERMEQAAQQAREETGQVTDVSQTDQQQDTPESPSTDV